MCSTLSCGKCGHKSRSFDNFMDLSVSIPRKAYRYSGCALSINECLSTFTSPEKLESCGFKCEKCKGVDCMTKEFSVFRFPKILVIHLKRFYNSTMRREKLSTAIDIPQTLDMRDYGNKNSSK
jgi:ubiquitin carboxyl-terminal hydrolase 2/21